MTDRVNGVYVALDKDYRTDDVEKILQAILMIKGVLAASAEDFTVEPRDWIAERRVREEIYKEIINVIYPKRVGE